MFSDIRPLLDELWRCGHGSSDNGCNMEKIKDAPSGMWECKQCHRSITDDENMAYHLVDMALYGWCESCFRRNQS
jgi:hypothetical protein